MDFTRAATSMYPMPCVRQSPAPHAIHHRGIIATGLLFFCRSKSGVVIPIVPHPVSRYGCRHLLYPFECRDQSNCICPDQPISRVILRLGSRNDDAWRETRAKNTHPRLILCWLGRSTQLTGPGEISASLSLFFSSIFCALIFEFLSN